MPNIRFFETDNTGSSPVEDLAVVFVTGTLAIALDENDVSKEDANHCIYIPSTATDMSLYFADADYNARYGNASSQMESSEAGITGGAGIFIDTVHLVQSLVGNGYGVVYMDVTKVSSTTYTYIHAFDINEDNFADAGELWVTDDGGVTFTRALEFDQNVADENGYYTRSATVHTGYDALTENGAFNFLNDKNAYDVKFISFGTNFAIPVSLKTGESEQPTSKFSFDFTLVNNILPLCGERKDCSVLVDLNYYGEVTANEGITVSDDIAGKAIASFTEGSILASDFKAALNDTPETADSKYRLTTYSQNTDLTKTDVSSRAYALLSNATMQYSYGLNNYTLIVPSSLMFLFRYAQTNKRSTSWLPITGVNRGVVEGTFTPDLSISKYLIDTEIISDGEGISFNGVCVVRPYGYTIWGDRTLIKQEKSRGVQATSYFSLRNLVSDVAKTVYNSAIRNTYETNNDVTWFNFKQNIVTLLDQVVSSGVLQSYKISRRITTGRNKMVAVITLYPVLPVENFDIYVNLENAEVTTSDETTA